MKYLMIFFALILYSSVLGQIHPDFEVTDSDGNIHRLYEDYLDKGTTVVIKIFFVDCPPCNAIAKDVQQLYEDWGEGDYDVQFFEMTTVSRDSDADINGYKAKHGITFPGVSNNGGAKAIVDLYKSSTFGTYYGTPSFSVISPDRSTNYGSGNLDGLNDRIKATGAQGKVEVPVSTTFQVNLNWPDGYTPDHDSLHVSLKSMTDGSVDYDLMDLTNGTLRFSYPSEEIPEFNQPFVTVQYQNARSSANDLGGADVIILRKHILGLKLFETDQHLKAADTNADGKINGNDVVILRKVILGILSNFRNGVSGHIPYENNKPLNVNPGNEVSIPFEMLKMGNFN